MARLTKKEKRKQVTEIIVKNMLMAVGLEISNTFILDQDSGFPWKVNNKFVRYNPNKVLTIHKDQVLFEPLDSRLQVKDLLNIAIAKAARYDNVYIKSIYPQITVGSKQLVALFEKDRMVTECYEHEILIYYDMMFRINEMLTPSLLNTLREADKLIITIKKKPQQDTPVVIKKGPFSDVYVQS